MTITEIVLSLLLVATALALCWALWQLASLQTTMDRMRGMWERTKAELDAYPLAEELPDDAAGGGRVVDPFKANTNRGTGPFAALALVLVIAAASVTSKPAFGDPMDPTRFNQMVQAQQLTRIERNQERPQECVQDLGLVLALMDNITALQARIVELEGNQAKATTDGRPTPTNCHPNPKEKQVSRRGGRRVHDHVWCDTPDYQGG
jgi:hypothetical protein